MGTMKTSGKQRLSLSDEQVALFVHPRTGQRLRPLGVTPKGRIIWPMMGASPDDPSNSDKEDETGADDDDPEDGKSKDSEGGGDPNDEDSKSKDGNPDAKIEDLEQEKERHFRRRKEAEKRAEELERELAELKGKDTPEQEKLQAKVDELTTSVNSLTESLTNSRLEVAFLKDNSYSWHNPGRALALADLSEVEIDDDGKVHGLKAALDKLAKSDPYLIQEGKAPKDEKKSDKPDAPDTSRTNKNPSKKEQSKDAREKQAADLVKKYPALRR